MRLFLWSGREHHRAIRARTQRPETVDLQRRVARAQGAKELSGRWIKRIDLAVAEIADQQSAGKLAEAGRGNGQAPRGIQGAVGDERLQLVAAGIEHDDIAEARSLDLLRLILLAQGVGHVDLVA